MKTKTAGRVEDVISVLEFAEREARSGSQVAVMLSYEAAPAFDPALVTYQPSEFPLAWAASFTNAPEISTGLSFSNSWAPRVSRDEYDRSVARIKELIAAGDTYQVNYTFPLTAVFDGDPFAWFQELCVAQSAPYSVYLDLGRYKVLCLSPELFFQRRGNHVITKPMKGTVRRGRSPAEDRELAQWLRESAKDRAENVMIVDLLRNDLGKVAIPGSVRVSSLFDLERFETVWQMTSTVEATLKDGTTLVDLMTALFPCGSITGAPKIRAMEILEGLEPVRRGPYTGACGWIGPDGSMQTSILIRTFVADGRQLTLHVGGGITWKSDPAEEWAETVAKASGPLSSIGAVESDAGIE